MKNRLDSLLKIEADELEINKLKGLPNLEKGRLGITSKDIVIKTDENFLGLHMTSRRLYLNVFSHAD
jgi:hypothetical protein